MNAISQITRPVPFHRGSANALQRVAAPIIAVVNFFAPWRGHAATGTPSYPALAQDPLAAAANAGAVEHGYLPSHHRTRAHAPTVRVLRVVDASCSAHSAGRMRISGRIADVCAELDRLSRQSAA